MDFEKEPRQHIYPKKSLDKIKLLSVAARVTAATRILSLVFYFVLFWIHDVLIVFFAFQSAVYICNDVFP